MIDRFNLRKAFHDYLKSNLKAGFEYTNSVSNYTPRPTVPYVDIGITLGQPSITLSNGDQENALGFCQIDVRTPHSFNWFGHEDCVDYYTQLFDKGPDTVAKIDGQTTTINAVTTSNSVKDESHFLTSITVSFRVIG